MMSDNIVDDIYEQNRLLDVSVKMLRKTGEDLARAEQEYKVTLAKEALKLRDEGMAITLIDKVVYGIKAVANARFDRDCKEAIYKANQEAINTKKLYVKVLVDQYNKEWSLAKNE